MANTQALQTAIRNAIDFETLLGQARVALQDYAAATWSNTDEHDPGITMLQTLCYNTSDLAYRSCLPIADLLTPPPSEQVPGSGIFPASFGPQSALTCGPIAEDDYRRAILDLHSTGDDDGYFYVANARLIREPEAERYRYWYDHDLREYTFRAPAPDNPST